MKNRVITISRQLGSGGRTIGRELSKKLDIPCYDQEIISMLAGESGFSEDYIKDNSEYAMHKGFLAGLFSDRVYDTPITQDVLWETQRRVILELAQKGSCVIIGRCADHILADEADCLRVYLHADEAKRAKRVVEIYGETAENADKLIADKDKRREAYILKYTGKKWGDADNYHITLDTGELGIEKCTELIAGLY